MNAIMQQNSTQILQPLIEQAAFFPFVLQDSEHHLMRAQTYICLFIRLLLFDF